MRPRLLALRLCAQRSLPSGLLTVETFGRLSDISFFGNATIDKHGARIVTLIRSVPPFRLRLKVQASDGPGLAALSAIEEAVRAQSLQAVTDGVVPTREQAERLLLGASAGTAADEQADAQRRTSGMGLGSGAVEGSGASRPPAPWSQPAAQSGPFPGSRAASKSNADLSTKPLNTFARKHPTADTSARPGGFRSGPGWGGRPNASAMGATLSGRPLGAAGAAGAASAAANSSAAAAAALASRAAAGCGMPSGWAATSTPLNRPSFAALASAAHTARAPAPCAPPLPHLSRGDGGAPARGTGTAAGTGTGVGAGAGAGTCGGRAPLLDGKFSTVGAASSGAPALLAQLGLVNPGALCYANAIVVALCHSRGFVEALAAELQSGGRAAGGHAAGGRAGSARARAGGDGGCGSGAKRLAGGDQAGDGSAPRVEPPAGALSPCFAPCVGPAAVPAATVDAAPCASALLELGAEYVRRLRACTQGLRTLSGAGAKGGLATGSHDGALGRSGVGGALGVSGFGGEGTRMQVRMSALELKRAVGRSRRAFQSGSQQDCHEFLVALLELAHNELCKLQAHPVPAFSAFPVWEGASPARPDESAPAGSPARPPCLQPPPQPAPPSLAQPTPPLRGGSAPVVDLAVEETAEKADAAGTPGAAAAPKEAASEHGLSCVSEQFQCELIRQFECAHCFHRWTLKQPEISTGLSLDLPERAAGGNGGANATGSSAGGCGGTSAGGGATAASGGGLCVSQLLRSYFAPQYLEVNCDRCKTKGGRAKVTPLLSRLPRALLLHLKRFTMDPRSGKPLKVRDAAFVRAAQSTQCACRAALRAPVRAVRIVGPAHSAHPSTCLPTRRLTESTDSTSPPLCASPTPAAHGRGHRRDGPRPLLRVCAQRPRGGSAALSHPPASRGTLARGVGAQRASRASRACRGAGCSDGRRADRALSFHAVVVAAAAVACQRGWRRQRRRGARQDPAFCPDAGRWRQRCRRRW